MTDIGKLLKQEPPEERPVKANYFGSLQITSYAFEKAYAYARLVNEIFKDPYMECSGYLIKPKESIDRVATDAFFARNQKATERQFILNGEDVINAGKEIWEMGYSVLGWWHSHGIMQTFFSPIDIECQMVVLNQVAPSNYEIARETTEIEIDILLQGKVTKIRDKNNPEVVYEIESESPEGIEIAGMKRVHEVRKSFAYGLVVNNWGKERRPYAEIAVRNLCLSCGALEDYSFPAQTEVISGAYELNENELRKEINEKIDMRKPMFGFNTLNPFNLIRDRQKATPKNGSGEGLNLKAK